MLKTLKDLMASLLPPSPAADPRAAEQSLQLATAVLLVEVMRADDGFPAEERRAVIDALGEHFALPPDALARLVELAEQHAREATDLFGFTSLVDERFDMPAKIRIVEQMWRVAYADGHLAAHERHVLWRVADLLHVPHGAYVNARIRAEKASTAGSGGPRDDRG